MKEYTVIYKNKPSKVLHAYDRTELIRNYFQNDTDLFKKEVSRVVWSEISMQCVLDTETGKVSSELFTADINPYGWRDVRD